MKTLRLWFASIVAGMLAALPMVGMADSSKKMDDQKEVKSEKVEYKQGQPVRNTLKAGGTAVVKTTEGVVKVGTAPLRWLFGDDNNQ